MKLKALLSITVIFSALWAGSALAVDCSGLPEWKRQSYYLLGAKVQYLNVAYENTAASSKFDVPAAGAPWSSLGACSTSTPDPDPDPDPDPQSMSIYGVWHCGNHFCDWSQVREWDEFDRANRWIIDRDGTGNYRPAVNLVVLSFLKPMELLQGTTNNAFANGIPVGMTPEVVSYFTARKVRVLLSLGGVTYTDSWNQALVSDPTRLAQNAEAAVASLGADGLEIDWENGTPTVEQLAGLEIFIETYNALASERPTRPVLTLDLAVGNRYLQELSRRAAVDWLPNGRIDYVNAMVPRGEPSTSQWQEHVDGKANYAPPILPKAPAKVVVSMWLTNSRTPHANCVNFSASTQKSLSGYVQSVQPNGAGTTAGFLGYMFWAAECPSTRNVCTAPPNSCEGGMGAGASFFDIQPLEFSKLRKN